MSTRDRHPADGEGDDPTASPCRCRRGRGQVRPRSGLAIRHGVTCLTRRGRRFRLPRRGVRDPRNSGRSRSPSAAGTGCADRLFPDAAGATRGRAGTRGTPRGRRLRAHGSKRPARRDATIGVTADRTVHAAEMAASARRNRSGSGSTSNPRHGSDARRGGSRGRPRAVRKMRPSTSRDHEIEKKVKHDVIPS